jgi:adenylate cyclase
MPDPVARESNVTSQDYRWHHETRSAWLRLIALVILVTNLLAAEHVDSALVRAYVILAYGLATICGLGLAPAKRSPAWVSTLFVVIDAALVVALFHERLFAPDHALDHSLTALTLATGFLLLTHVALQFKPGLVLLFSGLVVAGWLALLAITAVLSRRTASSLDTELWPVVMTEGALTASFSFAAFVCYLLTKDHYVLLNGAVLNERRRQNLARFFPPNIVSVLQTRGISFGLSRRKAAIMFVDLRAFTAFSETRPPEDVAEMLAEYRYIITHAVFNYGGTIDKFIGDGVMAVFGQPHSAPDDAVRALECSLRLKDSLAR